MIIFDLRCAANAHVFEAWFGSTADYDSQQARGLVSCPLCGSLDVAKAPMAPAVPRKQNRRSEPRPATSHVAPDPESMKQMLAALAAMQKQVLEKSEHVGDRFADEARAIHLGEADARSIHGRATPAETESLLDEGIAIAPLPFPIVEPGQEN